MLSETLRNLTTTCVHHKPYHHHPSGCFFFSTGSVPVKKESGWKAFFFFSFFLFSNLPADSWRVQTWLLALKTLKVLCAGLNDWYMGEAVQQHPFLWWAGQDMGHRSQKSDKQKKADYAWTFQTTAEVAADGCPWRFLTHERPLHPPSPSSYHQALCSYGLIPPHFLLDTMFQATLVTCSLVASLPPLSSRWDVAGMDSPDSTNRQLWTNTLPGNNIIFDG